MKSSKLVIGGIYRLNYYLCHHPETGKARFSTNGRTIDVMYRGVFEQKSEDDFYYLKYKFLIVQQKVGVNINIFLNDVVIWQMVSPHPKYKYVDNQRLVSSLEDIYAAV